MRVIRSDDQREAAERASGDEESASRAQASNREADREITHNLLDFVRESGETAVRVWTPGRMVAFGRRDSNADGYDAARDAARRHDFPPVERQVGGRAVAYTDSTLAFARIEPIDDIRTGLSARYDEMVADVLSALDATGVNAREGEPPNSFCPGDHSIRDTGKLAGIAQRVTKGAALTSGVLIVADAPDIRDVLTDVYRELNVDFDPESVGSIADEGGDCDAIRDEVERALIGDSTFDVERVQIQ